MFNGNYISIDSVLGEVKSYPFTEGLTKREAAHSLVNLLQLVGSTMPLVRVYKDIEIVMHKGELPKDIMFLHGANNKGNSVDNKGIAMRYASDIYHSVLHSDEAKEVCAGTSIGPEEAEEIYPKVADEDASWHTNMYVAPSKYTYSYDDLPETWRSNSYTINGMSIDCSFPYGWVEIAYDSVQSDEDGFPMIPDNTSFKTAFKYYLLRNAAEPAFYRGDVQRYVYDDIEKQYNWYIGQASNSLNMPTTDQMEMWSNALLRMIPKRGQFKDGWRSATGEEKFRY